VIAVGNGVIVRANRALRRMSGYSQEELVGRHVREFTYPEDRQLSDPFVKMFLAGEIFSFTLEKRYLRKDGQHFWAQATTAATHGPDGRFAFALGIVEDITERKQAEEALKRERHTLKRMLEASDHERRLISYDIHDGLAQELAGAIMYFQIYARAREAEAKDAAKAFDTGVMMLQQSYVEARRLISGVRPPILDESGVVAAIAHMVYDPAFDRGPKIDLRNRVAFQRLDPILENVIYRIVQEGLTNARNHSRSEKIRVSLVQRAKRLWIEIRDWGLGFDPQTVRANRFGLEGICERARLLGGNCRIHSKPGKGTSVIVELPVVERERKQEP
jgi:PAS domain S-box-containing protein